MSDDKQKKENLEEAVDEIKQKFGEGSIMKLEDISAVDVDAIPTGSLDLDLALGVRGIPRGRLVEIFGPEASGKTTLALHVTAEAQKQGGTAAYVDAEHALDPQYAKKIGVDVKDLLISQPDSGEQALEILESLVRSEAVDVIVVDSVAALTPQKEIAGEMGDDQVALQARLMSKACLTGDTELIDPVTGELSTIGEIVDNESSWHTTTYDEKNDEFVISEVTDWMPRGEKEVFEVETEDGHTLKLTDDHKLFTMKGWKEVEDLTQEDYLAIPRKAPVSESNSSEKLSDEAIKIVGYIIGDGNFTTDDYNLGFSNIDSEIIKDLESALDKFNCKLTQINYKDYRIAKKDKLPSGSYRSPVKEMLRDLDVHGKKAPQKEIPPEIFQLPKDKLALFISRLWACDGTVDLSVRAVNYSSTSKKLIKQLQNLLLKFGIVARYFQDGPSPSYKLVIQGAKNIQIFTEEIGVVGEKDERLQNLAQTGRKSKVVPFEEAMPYALVPEVKEKVHSSGHTGKEVSHMMGLTNRTSFPEWKPSRLRLSRDHLRQVADLINDENLEELADQEVYWAKISSIVKKGKEEVYDLSVKDHPNFVANGVLVHNCRKLSGIVSDTKTSVIFLNQTRMKIGIRFGDPTTTPGGKALKFYSSVRIKLNRKAKIKEGDEITGSRVKAKVVKNKVAAPFRTAVFDIFYNQGISESGDLIRTGTKYDVIERAGSWYKYGDDKLGQGRSNSRDYLEENPEVAEEIREKIIKTYKEQSDIEESEEDEEKDEKEDKEDEEDKEEKEDKKDE